MITFRPRAYNFVQSSYNSNIVVPANGSASGGVIDGPLNLLSLKITGAGVAGLETELYVDLESLSGYYFSESTAAMSNNPDFYTQTMQDDALFHFSSNAANTQKVLTNKLIIPLSSGLSIEFTNTTASPITVASGYVVDIQVL